MNRGQVASLTIHCNSDSCRDRDSGEIRTVPDNIQDEHGAWLAADEIGGNLRVPRMKMTFGVDGAMIDVDPTHPLPVLTTSAADFASGVAALTGTSTGAAIVGPFTPALGRQVMLTLSGSWTGVVSVLRSINGSASKLPLTLAGQPYAQFTAAAQEPVWIETEAGATLWLSLPATGITYRMAQ